MSEISDAGVYRLARNSGAILVSRVSILGARLVATMITARYLGQALFGDYSYVVALIGSIEVLSDFGLNQIAIREIAKRRDKADEYFGSALILKIITALIALVILVLVANTVPAEPHVRLGLYLYGTSAILNYLVNTYFVLYRASERMQYQAVLILVERGLYVLLLIALVSGQASFVELFWANMIAVVVKLIVGTWVTSTRFTLPKFHLDWGMYKKYVLQALPVGVGLIIAGVSIRINIVLLGFLQTSEVVGIFSGPYRIVDAVTSMSAVLIIALFPVMARRARVGEEVLRQLLEKAAKFSLLVAIPLSIGLVILARPAVLLVLGDEFLEAQGVLQLLAVVIAPLYLNRLFNFALISVDRQVEYAYVSGIALLSNVVIALILIPIIGYWGACAGAILGEIIRLNLGYWRISRRVGRLRLWPVVKSLIMPNLGMALVVLVLMSWSWVVAVLAGALVYPILIRFSGVLDMDERRVFRQALSKVGYPLG